ncbi:hypothetical protein SaccyDRAFT_2476 [Saccharomonospora cyanea NA-134]|uniref:Uncharacterized protein n=1 Tax=Saccharomonospora cyanea NA-134 TaxID=882082 RepID=H5XDM6_9PSEU|nr:hypothetical protein SaccyDRAFT_2476 [Saccharomonospora cyanea NA-134]
MAGLGEDVLLVGMTGVAVGVRGVSEVRRMLRDNGRAPRVMPVVALGGGMGLAQQYQVQGDEWHEHREGGSDHQYVETVRDQSKAHSDEN